MARDEVNPDRIYSFLLSACEGREPAETSMDFFALGLRDFVVFFLRRENLHALQKRIATDPNIPKRLQHFRSRNLLWGRCTGA